MAIKLTVKRGDVIIGVYSQKELIEKLGNGMISCYDMIYFPKKDEWLEIDSIKDIGKYVSEGYHWKYKKEGTDHGPIARDDLIFFIKEGKISATDEIYHPCLKEWKRVEEVSELKKFIEEVGEKKESEINIDEAFKVIDYKVCPKCGMQNLKTADSCTGCGYVYTDAPEDK